MEEVETLFNSVDKQNLQIWTNEFWDKIRKAERGMERSEKKWLLDQLTLVLAHLMGSLKEKKIASDDRSLLLFWLSYGNLSFSYDPRKGREFHKNFQGHARSLRFGRFFKNWYMMERSTQNPEGAIEVANYVRKYEIFDFDEFLRSTKITKSRPTKGGKRDIPETSTPLRPNTHPTSPNTPSSLLTPSRFAPSPCPSGPSLSLPLTPSTYSNTCFSTPTTSQKEKNFTPGPTSVPSSSSTSSSSSSKLKPCLRNKENAPESSERAQGLEHHVRLATDLKQPNGVLSEEPTPQKSSTGKKKGIHLKRMGLDGFQLKKAGEEEAKAKEAKKEEPTPLSSPTLDSSSDSPPHPSSSSLLTPSVSVSLPSPRSPLLSSSENIPQEQGKGEEREEQEREDPEKREMGELEREDREMEDREKEERERDAREKAEREREEQEVKEREEREREELEKEELEMEQLEREEREREEREKEEREKEEREREERRREQEKKKREQGERKKEESDKKEKEKIEKQEKMSQPIVSAILQHTPESIIEVNHNNYIKLEEIGKGGSATVYRVLDPALRCLALKCVDISSASEATIRGYVNEINHLKRVDQYNDHVILMHDFELCRERKIIRIVMELGEIDFQKFWKKHALEVLEKKLSWVKVMWQQMLEAVDSLHRCKVVHRDLKPANFVLCKGRLKLIDFGIAKEMDSGETKALCDQTVGTLNYMSPESLSSTGGNSFYLNRANDVWSLGCILYEMVYGMTPFQQYRTLITKLTKIQDPNHKISFPERFIGRGSTATQVVDRELLDVIRICLNRDMKARAHIADLLAHPFLKGKGAKVSKGGGVKRSGGKEGGEGSRS